MPEASVGVASPAESSRGRRDQPEQGHHADDHLPHDEVGLLRCSDLGTGGPSFGLMKARPAR